jgi:hypothetical protein
MSKSYVEELVEVYEALFRDAKYAFPALCKELDKSFAHIARVATTAGIPCFLQWLPALGKHFDKCLAEGEYKQSGLPFSKRRPNCVGIPVFLGELYLLVFDDKGCLRNDYDHTAIVFLRQFLYCAKKATVDCGSEREQREIRAFLELDASLPEPDEIWEQEHAELVELGQTYQGFAQSNLIRPRWYAETDGHPVPRRVFLRNLDIVSGLLSSALGPYRPEEWRHRHGPGLTSDVKPGESKYAFKNWSDRLESAFPYCEHAFHALTEWVDHCSQGLQASSEERASRLMAVPKSFDKPRLIAAEPSENMWCQQNIWHFMRERTSRTWIGKFVKFDDQTQNQEFCLRASRDGALSTVDLSSASDRVTCHAVGQLFRGNLGLLQALQATRTACIDVDTGSGDPVRVKLRKYSTMGNATTFPVETLLFLSIAIASVLTARKRPVTMKEIERLVGEVTVFGDDIIVPTDCRDILERALRSLYFKVNETKTFWTGLFRESCGVDAYRGEVVTPVYWHGPYRDTPESLASTVETAKNLYKRFYVRTSEHLRTTVPAREVPLVRMDSDVIGWTSFVDPGRPHCGFATRFNRVLQRREFLVRSVRAINEKEPLNDGSALLQFFTELPEPTTKWKSGIAQGPRLRRERRWVPVESLTLQG